MKLTAIKPIPDYWTSSYVWQYLNSEDHIYWSDSICADAVHNIKNTGSYDAAVEEVKKQLEEWYVEQFEEVDRDTLPYAVMKKLRNDIPFRHLADTLIKNYLIMAVW